MQGPRLNFSPARHAGLFAAAGVLAGMTSVFYTPWILLAAVCAVMYRKRFAWLLAASVASGMLAASLSQGTYSKRCRRLFPDGKAFRGEAVLRVEDASATTLDLPMEPVKTLRCRLKNYRDELDGKVHPGNGSFVLLRMKVPQKLQYGDEIRSSGIFSPPCAEVVYLRRGDDRREEQSGFFDAESFYRSRDITGIFSADDSSLNLLQRTASPMVYALDLRDFLMRYISGGIEPEERKLMAMALFFGFQPGLDAPLRQDLIRSGTIHLFAVSGFHVGVAALMLYAFLWFVPFRTRQYLLVAGTGLYVLATGMPTAATRAWIMILIFSLIRAHLRYLPGTDILGWTCALMLFIRPMWIGDMGFVYSFLLTLILLGLSIRLTTIRSILLSEQKLLPHKQKTPWWARLQRMRHKFYAATATCLAAALAGGLLSLSYQGMFPWAAPLANLLLLPLVSLLFLTAGLRLLLGFLPWIGSAIAWVQSELFGLFEACAVWGATYTDLYIPRAVTPFLLWLLLGSFIAFFLTENRILRYASAGVFAAIVLGLGILRPAEEPYALCLYSGGNDVPSLLLADPVRRSVVLVNVPSVQAARHINAVLRKSGLGHIDLVVFDRNTLASSRGAEVLNSLLTVRQTALLAERPARRAVSGVNHMTEANHIETAFAGQNHAGCRIFREKNELHIEYSRDGSKFMRKIILREAPDRYSLIVDGREVALNAGNLAEAIEL